ncbi:MAG: hypothetical protein HUU01_17400 [Saprospiraceae bacterium]|nr:hypothetical protein [Saprospiraceae bacterium]
MKYFFPLLVVFYWYVACTPKKTNHHLPSVPARFFIEVQVTPGDGIPMEQALDDLAKLAADRLEMAGVNYQSIETDAAANTIRFRLIGSPGAQRGSTPDDEAVFFQNVIIPKAELEFWDIYQVSDSGLATPFARFYEEGFLFKYLEYNAQGQLGSAVFGIADAAHVPVIDSFLALPEKKALFPSDLLFGWARARMGTGQLELYALKTGNKPAPLTSRDLADAYVHPGGRPNDAQVGLDFKADAAVVWEKMTRKAAEDHNRGIAIVLNGKILSVPLVMQPITVGKSSLSAGFTFAEAQDLALQLKMTMAGHRMTLIKTEAL